MRPIVPRVPAPRRPRHVLPLAPASSRPASFVHTRSYTHSLTPALTSPLVHSRCHTHSHTASRPHLLSHPFLVHTRCHTHCHTPSHPLIPLPRPHRCHTRSPSCRASCSHTHPPRAHSAERNGGRRRRGSRRRNAGRGHHPGQPAPRRSPSCPGDRTLANAVGSPASESPHAAAAAPRQLPGRRHARHAGGGAEREGGGEPRGGA